MDLSGYQNILAIAEEGNISKAADRLFMAQSTLSQFLKQTEKELGSILFVRTSTGVRPTYSGEIMIQYARDLLKTYRQMRTELLDIEDLKSGRIELGISTYRGSYILPRVMKNFREKYPGIHVVTTELNSIALERMLIRGELDVGLIALPLQHLESDYQFLMKDEILIVTTTDHPVMKHAREKNGQPGKRFVSMADAAQYEFVLSDFSTILGRTAHDQFKACKIKPIACNLTMTAPFASAIARQGLALAFTYDSCREYSEKAEYLSIGENGIYLDLVLAFPPNAYCSKATKALIDEFFHVYRKPVTEQK